MLGYEKQPVVCKEKCVREEVDLGKGIGFQNCIYKDGVLRVDGGVNEYRINGQSVYLAANLPLPKQFFRIPRELGNPTLGYVSATGNVLKWDETAGAFVGLYNFGSQMKALNTLDNMQKERLLFFGCAGIYEYDDNRGWIVVGQSEREIAPLACTCKDRVFYVLKPYSIVYSAPLLPTQFMPTAEDSGTIAFPCGKGDIVAIVPHGKGIAIFYEYGVAVLETDGSARDFKWKAVAYGGGKILQDSAGNAGVGGEKTFFLAEDGVYVLDGTAVRKVCVDLDVRAKCAGQVCEHSECNGKYYVAYNDYLGKRTGLIIDTQTEKGCYSFEVNGLSVCGGVGLCMTSGWDVCVLGGENLPSGAYARVRYEQSDFTVRRDSLRSVKAYGEGTVYLEIEQGKNRKAYTLDLSNGSALANVRMRGERFSLYCRLEQGACLRGLILEWGALKSATVKHERGRRVYGN